MIYVVRHGQTDLNKEQRMQGRMGLPLNEIGIKQAEKLKDLLKEIHFDYVFSSPQHRAIQTTEIITCKQAIIDNRLDVFDLGEADRLRVSEVVMDGIVPDSRIYPGMEDSTVFLNRVLTFMRDLELEMRNRDVNILISGHRCTTGCIGAYFEGIPKNGNILSYSSNNGEYKTYQFHR